MTIRTYDPAFVVLVVGDTIPTDVAADTMYVVSKDEDRVMPLVGVKGEVAIAKNRNSLGTLTISLKQTSPTNQVLMNYYAATAAGGSDFIFNVTLVDPSSAIELNTQGWVQTQPEFTMGKEVSQLDWVIGLANADFVKSKTYGTINDVINVIQSANNLTNQ